MFQKQKMITTALHFASVAVNTEPVPKPMELTVSQKYAILAEEGKNGHEWMRAHGNGQPAKTMQDLHDFIKWWLYNVINNSHFKSKFAKFKNFVIFLCVKYA